MTELPRAGEIELVRRWATRRDEQAVAELWRRHQRLAVHLAARILHREPDAIELARGLCDEAFVQALRTFAPGRAAPVDQPFRTWFLTIARRRAIDRVRQHRPVAANVPMVAVDPDQVRHIVNGEELAIARAWVLRHFLPADWEAVTQYAEGFTWVEIAAANPVRIPGIVTFQRGSTHPDPGWRDDVVRILTLCPKIEVRIIGNECDDGVSGLARARVVRDLLVEACPGSARRLTVMAAEGEPQVCFEVTRGATRSPDAQRMRIQTILGRYRRVAGAA
jgi:RNA polymerase sigma factor (sigma-70 family)